jgi:hypothetical protein
VSDPSGIRGRPRGAGWRRGASAGMRIAMVRRALLPVLFAALLGATASAAPGPRPIEDDWPRALAEAKRLGVPVLVDVWAPW